MSSGISLTKLALTMCLFLFFCFIFLTIPIAADYSMVVVYGKPQSFLSANTNSKLSWNQCIRFCWEAPTCVLAYNVKGDGCQWFVHNNISTVKQTKKANGYIVAFKINSTSNTCRSGTNPPTFNNKSVSGSAAFYFWETNYGVRFNYTITLSKELWTFKFVYKTACPTLQFAFNQHKNGIDYCFILMFATPNFLTSEKAQTGCSGFNKTIWTGATTDGELKDLKSMMIRNRGYPAYSNYVLRVHGTRKASCQATPTTKECMSSKGFTFNDSMAQTLDLYTWATDSGARATPTSDCIVLILDGDKPIVADVQSCGASGTSLPALSYMCGREAWADYSMIVVYGKPQSFLSVNTNSKLSWNQCIRFCLKAPTCVLAYNVKADGCQWFVHNNISTVKQTKKANGYIVAFKINSTSNTCLSGTNPPTFNNKPVSGSAALYFWETFYGVRFNYTITLSKELWTFKFVYKIACPTLQFVLTQRKNGKDWCIILMLANPGLTSTDAQNSCSGFNKTIYTGVTTAGELKTVKYMMNNNRKTLKSNNYVLRVHGTRTKSCQATPNTKECKSSKGFTFNDPIAKTLDSYTWATSSGARATPTSDCIVLILDGNKPIVADVQSCGGTGTSLPALSYMCGREAWVW